MIVLHAKHYYPADVYPILMAAGGVAIESWIRMPVLRGAIVAAVVAAGLFFAPFSLPVLSEPAMVDYGAFVGNALHIKRSAMQTERHRTSLLPDDWADMHGWPELAATVAQIYDALPPEAARASRDRGKQLRRSRGDRFLRARNSRLAAGALRPQQLLALGYARLQRQRHHRRQRRLRRRRPPLSHRASSRTLRSAVGNLVRAEHSDHGLHRNPNADCAALAEATSLHLASSRSRARARDRDMTA